MRSTRRGSPMRRVLTLEGEGISKFWKIKVMTKRPMARTVQMEARDSSGVSACSCWATSGVVASVVMVSGKTLLHRYIYQCIADGGGGAGGFGGGICGIFFWRGEDEGFWCFCRGFWGKRGGWMWFFCGVTVVECVVNVVF